MNVLTQTWRQLVRRRLWPVALLLVAALVAVPVVLAKPGTPDPAAAPPQTTTAAAPVATPAPSYVKLASDDSSSTKTRAHHVLGARKDPFTPAPLPKPKHHKKKAAKPAVAAQATATATAAPADSAPTTPSAPSTPVEPVPTAAPAPVKRYPANSVQVRFGLTTGDLAKSTLTRLDTLPSSTPLIVFMGFHKDGKVAEFMLTGTVTAEGDGSCSPSVNGCETLLLHKGETEFLTFSGTAHDGQYELDLKALHPADGASSSDLKVKATPAATPTP